MRTNSTATELLGRLIAPLGRCLTPTAAKEILSLHADESARRRIEELALQCDAGALTPEERAEYQLFVEVGDLVALLQAKAERYWLKKATQGEDVGFLFEGKVVALRPVEVVSTDYALQEYGVTAKEMTAVEKRIRSELKTARKRGEVTPFEGS